MQKLGRNGNLKTILIVVATILIFVFWCCCKVSGDSDE
jgi:hypothetical protein